MVLGNLQKIFDQGSGCILQLKNDLGFKEKFPKTFLQKLMLTFNSYSFGKNLWDLYIQKF